jgi:hypothetical protein
MKIKKNHLLLFAWKCLQMCESVVERECDVTGNKITNCYREWF